MNISQNVTFCRITILLMIKLIFGIINVYQCFITLDILLMKRIGGAAVKENILLDAIYTIFKKNTLTIDLN